MENYSENDLSGVELEYAFARAAKFDVFGSPPGPFALLDRDERSIFIFGGTAESIKPSSFEGNVAEIALQTAKELGAQLFVENGMVKCCIGQQSAYGESYLQALMRAVVRHSSSMEQRCIA